MPRTSRPLYHRVREILESARTRIARSVNTTQVVANWLVGREIVEAEQTGKARADYGDQLILQLSLRLQRDFGSGYSATNLKLFRKFFLHFPALVPVRKGHTPRDLLPLESFGAVPVQGRALAPAAIGHTLCDQSWEPGRLHPISRGRSIASS